MVSLTLSYRSLQFLTITTILLLCLNVPVPVQEGVGVGEDGQEETLLMLEPGSSFGEIAILCNIPQPYTVRVCELCRLLRLDKQSFTNILEIYFVDGRRILSNLTESTEYGGRVKQLESDITFHIGKQEAELTLRVNSAAFYGDLSQLKSLIRAGADPKNTDYDGRTPLVRLRAEQLIAHFLITLLLVLVQFQSLSDNMTLHSCRSISRPREGTRRSCSSSYTKAWTSTSPVRPYAATSIHLRYLLPSDRSPCSRSRPLISSDQFGNTPLLEAVKRGHDRVASLLHGRGAKLSLTNAGSHLCTAVAKGDSDFIRRALAYGADPNCRDYDHRTPLHIAAAEGLYLIAKILIDAGASVFATDR